MSACAGYKGGSKFNENHCNTLRFAKLPRDRQLKLLLVFLEEVIKLLLYVAAAINYSACYKPVIPYMYSFSPVPTVHGKSHGNFTNRSNFNWLLF